VYPGPIGAVLTPLLEPDRRATTELANASSLCGACTEACPVKIPLHDMLVHLRARNVESGRTKWSERVKMKLAAGALHSPTLFAWASRLARTVQRTAPSITSELAAWTKQRDLPPPASRSFREMWPELERETRP
jgi:L-lactate dehydrogenase complex protein LldF